MVNVFTKDGPVSFLARGINKYGSKNRGLILPLTYGKFTLEKGKAGGLSLVEGVAESYVDPTGDFSMLAFISFVGELTSKASFIPDNAGIFEYLNALVKNIKNISIYTNSILYLCHILSYLGYSPYVDGCLECGSKTNIVGFSFSEGGFYCRDHLPEAEEKMSPYRLKMIRYLFKSGIADYGRVSFPDDEAKWALHELAIYTEEVASIHLNSVTMLCQ